MCISYGFIDTISSTIASDTVFAMNVPRVQNIHFLRHYPELQQSILLWMKPNMLQKRS